MDITTLRPSTVDGIKKLAKQIRRERNCTHTVALTLACNQAGFSNLVHAKRQLAIAHTRAQHLVFLSVHWRHQRDRSALATHSDGPTSGRELLSASLSRPLADIVAKHRVGLARGLAGFRMEYDDHLEFRTNLHDQGEARKVLLAALRSLRFMEATGLQPVTLNKHRERLARISDMPARDHLSYWFDPPTDTCLALDEPYVPAFRSNIAARHQWLAGEGWHMVEPAWAGIYKPGECHPTFIGPDEDLLRRTAAALASYHTEESHDTWPHESGMYGEDFVSPQRHSDTRPRRPRPGPSWQNHMGASPYGGQPGIPSNWRPTKAMPVKLHQQLGPLLTGLRTGFSWRVTQRLGWLRSRLEDWSVMEHRDEPGIYDVYIRYGQEAFTTDGQRQDSLTKAREIIERGYDDCKPRREILAAVGLALEEVQNR